MTAERFEILRGPDPDRFALRFVFGNGDRRFIGTDFRRRGDARNVAAAIELGVLEAAYQRCRMASTELLGGGFIEVRDLTLLDDDGRPSPYHRANRGQVVHLEACGFSRLAHDSTPWALVRHWTPAAVLAEVAGLPWLRLCQRCWPPVIRRLDEAAVQDTLTNV